MTGSTQDDLHRRIADALARIQVVTGAAGRKAAEGEGLSPLQATLLRTLSNRPGMRIGALAKHLRVTDGTISVAIDALEAKGLVRRAPDPDEHRAVLVIPTAKGRRTSTRLTSWADEQLAPIIAEVGESSAGVVLASLLTVIDAAERKGLIDPTRMCLQCRYFGPWEALGADGERPHRCGLLGRDIGAVELQIDCPDFEAREPGAQDDRPQVLPRT